MGRFSPSVSPTPSWTNGMAEGVQNIGQALMQRRMFNQRQSQQDITNAENGVYRGQAPAGAMTVQTPDFQMTDTPNTRPDQNVGVSPQLQQTTNASVTYSGGRPVPGGISALNPMTDALMAARGQGGSLPPSSSGGATFNGPDGKGFVDPTRYQQIKTPGGDQFYLDREQTPDAQALRRSVLSGEMGFNKAMTVQLLRNSGMLANTDDRNAGLAYRTDALNASYGPGGARYQGTISKMQQMYGYTDPSGQYVPGSVPTGKIYTAAGEVPSKIAAAAPSLAERTRHDQVTEGQGAQRIGIASSRATANSPQQKQLSAVLRQTQQTQGQIGQINGQENQPLNMDPTARAALETKRGQLTQRLDSLTHVGDSISHAMQQPPAVSPASTSGVEKDGHAASTATPQPQGQATPMLQNKTDQHVAPVASTLPADPTAPSAFGNLSALYQKHQAYIAGRTDLDPITKANKQKELSAAYNAEMMKVAQPKK